MTEERSLPPDDPHELVRWCLKGMTVDGKLVPVRQHSHRNYLRLMLGLLEQRQLTDEGADILVSAARNDPAIWDDAVWAFTYHVQNEDFFIPRRLAYFAAWALQSGRPKRGGPGKGGGRHKGDTAQRNGYLRLAAQHLEFLGYPMERSPTNPALSVCSVISDVLNELGEVITPGGVRKILSVPPDPWEAGVRWFHLEQLRLETEARLKRTETP